MKRLLICLTICLVLVTFVGCNRSMPSTGDFSPTASPTSCPNPSPTSAPTPTPAPLSFQDLLDKSMNEEIILNTYSLITSDDNSYGYPAYNHVLYLENGKTRMTITISETETLELSFNSISSIDCYDTVYSAEIISLTNAILSWGFTDIHQEWTDYLKLLDKVEHAFLLSLENPFNITDTGPCISKLIIWQQHDTFYILFVDTSDITLGIRSAKYQDDTLTPTSPDWNFMDLLENSITTPLAFRIAEYIKNPALSSTIQLDISIKDKAFYVNNTTLPFTYTEDFEFKFDASIYHGAHMESISKNKGIASSLYKQKLINFLENSRSCYVENSENRFFAIYQIENTLYLLDIFASPDGGNTCHGIYAITIE